MLSDGVILLHGNANTARKTQELLRKFKWEVWNHPTPYSPDTAPNLGSKHLSGTRFSSESDVKIVVENWLNGQDVSSANLTPDGFAASTYFAQHCPCHLAASRLSATTFFSFKYCMKISGTDHKTIVDFIFFVDNSFL
ncbi:hypothetical protein AVEN_31799-1 [Araneus ventricosus]|uniref:Uncharacterized protein n=1 Tax=Araneus ventricosus TaxID=182803 RepID=A0A4Y2RSS6_ARAVE|nr:hypothetical protein AVEN_31799-1 [Araneus ventricosus]